MAQPTTAAATLDAERFRDPPAEYRSVPFWSWNDALTDDELRRQIEAMHDAGQGGFFMHSRVGLRTPYLSDDWFARVRTYRRGGAARHGRLALRRGSLAVRINGKDMPSAQGWWIDRVFQRYPLGSMLRPGRNTVEVSGCQSPEVELEAIYLTGGFAVPVTLIAGVERVTLTGQQFAPWHVRPRLAPEPASVNYAAGGDLVALGMPFFAGEVRLSQDVEIDHLQPESRAILSFDAVSAATALVEVNDVPVGQTLWPPYDVDVTDALQPGMSRISARLVTSLRNLLGPFHTPGGDPTFVGPASFRDQQHCTEERWLVPLGLGRAHLTISERA